MKGGISMSNTAYMLSTRDNPYNPFTEWFEWFSYDIENGWDSCGTLDKFATTSDSLTDNENEEEIEKAIDRIIELDPLNIYIKVTEKHPQGVPATSTTP